MKKSIVLGMAVIAGVLVAGCGGKMGGAIKGKSYTTEGWLDNDTFQVVAWGEANPDETGEARWRNQAKAGAQMMAEMRIMELFKGYALEASGYTEEGGNVMVIVSKEVEGFAKGGEIANITFNEKNKACEIAYRVVGKNLKKRVLNGFQISEKPKQ